MKTKKSNKNTTRSRNSKRTRKQVGGAWSLSSAKISIANVKVTSIDPIVFIDQTYFSKDNFLKEPGNQGPPTTLLGNLSIQSYRKEYSYDGNLELFMLWYKRYINSAADHFYFTRHFNSCNNINIGKYYPGKDNEPIGPIESLGNTYKFALDEKDYHDSRFNSNTVYVSCLLRTWCTAVILYCTKSKERVNNNGDVNGPRNEEIKKMDLADMNEAIENFNLDKGQEERCKIDAETELRKLKANSQRNLNKKERHDILYKLEKKYVSGDKFYLKICPHLKEYKDEHLRTNPLFWERGNFPRPLQMTMMRFLKFLNMMLYLKDADKRSTVFSHFDFEHWVPPEQIVLSFYDETGNIIQTTSKKNAEYKILLVTKKMSEENSKLEKEIYRKNNIFINYEIELNLNRYYVLDPETKHLLENQTFNYEIIVKQINDRTIFDKQPKNISDHWGRPNNPPNNEQDKTVYVVTHSNAMKQFFKDIVSWDTLTANEKKDMKLISNLIKGGYFFKNFDKQYNIKSQNCGTIEVHAISNSKNGENNNGENNNGENNNGKNNNDNFGKIDSKFYDHHIVFDLTPSDKYKVQYIPGYHNKEFDKKYEKYNGIPKLGKQYQYLCGNSDNTISLTHTDVESIPTVTTPSSGGTKKRRSKQKRRTQRKRRKH